MDISPEDKTAITNRLKRAAGQLGGVLRMVEDGADCAQIVTQLSACSKALDRAGFALMVCSLQSCIDSGEDGPDKQENIKRLEKLFLSLA